MPSLKAIRRRIRTVDSTKQITRAMKTVSASKMRRSLERMEAAKPYAGKLREIVTRLVAAVGGSVKHPFLETREDVGRILLLIVTADRGLCGAFNTTLIRAAEEFIRGSSIPVDLICIGKKGRDYFRRHSDCEIVAEYPDLRGNLDLATINEITQLAVNRFLAGEADEVKLLFNSYINAITYRPKVDPFLPIDPSQLHAGDGPAADREYIFEPDTASVFAEILPKQILSQVYLRLAEAFTAEHSARMIAMTNANDNCEDLLKTLTLDMNKARQAAITKELLEIVSGAEALKG